MGLLTFLTIAVLFVVLVFVLPSIRIIGPTEVGLVTKRFSVPPAAGRQPGRFHGEAGYQADLLMPGWRLKFWGLYAVEKHPWVQVRAGEIGVVVAQVGRPLPIGAKSAESVGGLNDLTNLRAWLAAGGQKGVQRPVLPPGSLMPVHPVAFLVITREHIYGVPVAQRLPAVAVPRQAHVPSRSDSDDDHMKVTVITPRMTGTGGIIDTCGIVTTLEGQPLPAGSIAGRLGEFDDIKKLETAGRPPRC